MSVPVFSLIGPALPTVSAGMAAAETIRRLKQTQVAFTRILAESRRVVDDLWEMLAAANDLLAKSHSSRGDAIR
jgi:hypothetical protein